MKRGKRHDVRADRPSNEQGRGLGRRAILRAGQ